MYIRVTRFEDKVDKIDEARALAWRLIPEIRQISGLKEFINAQRDDGSGVTIAVYASQADAEAAGLKAKELWSRFSNVWASPPVTEEYEVRIHEVID